MLVVDATAKTFWAALYFIFISVATGLELIAGYALLRQSFDWLRTGDWVPYPVSRLISEIGLLFGKRLSVGRTDWLGLDKIIAWLLDLHVAFLCVTFGIIFFAIAGCCWMLWEEAENRILRREREPGASQSGESNERGI